MTASAAGRHLAPPLAARLASSPSPTIFPATGASAGSQSRGGPSRRRVGGRTPVAPPTFSGDRLDEAQISATRERPFCWALHRSGPTASPLGRGKPPNVSSSPQSYRAPPPAAGVMMPLRCCGVVMMRMTPTCCSSRPPHWQHRHSTTAWATGPHQRRCPATPPFASWYDYRCGRAWRSGISCAAPCTQRASSHRGLVLVEDRLLRERRLGREEMGAFQLQRQGPTKINPKKIIP
jgi:hypothetical protein